VRSCVRWQNESVSYSLSRSLGRDVPETRDAAEAWSECSELLLGGDMRGRRYSEVMQWSGGVEEWCRGAVMQWRTCSGVVQWIRACSGVMQWSNAVELCSAVMRWSTCSDVVQ
jgi:hypothetical protein